MNKLTVTLETVTPLFMGGAEQQAELRPAAFRGALRFWWRALWGGTHGDDWEKMREAEANVFGDTGQASGIVIRLKPLEIPTPKPMSFSLDSGIGYLLWTTTRTNRECYPAGKTKFQIELSLRPGAASQNDFTEAAAALWLLINLGGIGTRARRGMGSLGVIEEPRGWPAYFPPLYAVSTGPMELANHVKVGIQGLHKALNWQTHNKLNVPTTFDILHHSASRVYVLKEPLWPDWSEALNGIGNLLKSFRGNKAPDHDGVLSVIQGQGHPRTVERAAFGLPMQFYYRGYHEQCTREEQNRSGILWREAQRKTRFKATAEVTVRKKEKESDRRASPLLFKVAPITNGKCAAVITFGASLKNHGELLC